MKLRSVFALVLCAFSAHAIPLQMNYQGSLADTAGEPHDTTVAMTFTLYDDAVAGAPLWTETHPVVNVQSGLFHVRLGTIAPLGDLFAADRWLGISIGGDGEMSPRQPVVSVAHAFRVGTLDGATGGTVNGDLRLLGYANIGTNNTSPGAGAFVTGSSNTAAGISSVVAGQQNVVSGNNSSITGGSGNNVLGGNSVIAGGQSNLINEHYSAVGGGHNNNTYAYGSVIDGGRFNFVGSEAAGATLGGGFYNRAHGAYSVVAGGGGPVAADSNSAAGASNVIGGGFRNRTADSASTVAGGALNAASGRFTSIGGGWGNQATGQNATVGGGRGNSASQSATTVAGGVWNIANSTDATVGGGELNHATGFGATVAGGAANVASGPGAFIGGGEGNGASSGGASIPGGAYNTASGLFAAIAGGYSNLASGERSVVAGGHDNDALGNYSSIAGGTINRTTGLYATVGGGIDNRATATASYAAGYRARANHSGSFVWSGTGSGTDSTASFAVFSFTARCSGGARFYTSQTGTATGVSLAAGGGAWASLSDSTQKENLRGVDTRAVLEKLAALRIAEWNYKTQEADIRHLGPMAQDFHAAFGLGENNTTITTVDADGVMIAAIQELAKRLQSVEERLAATENENTRLRTFIESHSSIINSSSKEN